MILFSLLFAEDFDFDFYKKMLQRYKLKSLISELIRLLKDTTEVKELGLNQQKLARLKKSVSGQFKG